MQQKGRKDFKKKSETTLTQGLTGSLSLKKEKKVQLTYLLLLKEFRRENERVKK